MDPNCPYPYGPIDAPTGCLSEKYEEDWLHAPYGDEAISVDWRDLGVVTPARQ